MRPELALDLHGPRLPEAFTHLGAADYLAGFGLGLLFAALLLCLFAPLIRRRPRRPGLRAQIQATRSLPQEEQVLALVRILQQNRGQALPDVVRQALYRGEGLAPATIEALIRGGKG